MRRWTGVSKHVLSLAGLRQPVRGEVVVPGDKSISHRALILGALARGRSYLGNVSPAADVASTAACLIAAGATLRGGGEGKVVLEGAGVGGSLSTPAAVLDCGNSGTTMRFLAAALVGHDLTATLDGDASLRRRPMRRVAVPLELMGAIVTPTSAGTAPLQVTGRRRLVAIEYSLPVASAQIKSAVLLAGLAAEGPTSVIEVAPSRDHTERLLRLCGIDVAESESGTGTGPFREGATGGSRRITVTPGPLAPFGLRVPGDLSSAAFFLALVAARPGWNIRCPGVTLNPGRIGIVEVLRAMGADVTIDPEEAAGGVEPVGTVTIRGAELRGTDIGGRLIPRCIDELPAIAVLATQAQGRTTISDAAELRFKESDRIASVAVGLRALGANCEVRDDGLVIEGPTRLRGAALDSDGDHRLAMAWAVAACLVDADAGPTSIHGAEAADVSYPGFFAELARLTG